MDAGNDITLEEARALRLEKARASYAPTVNSVLAAIREAAALGHARITVETHSHTWEHDREYSPEEKKEREHTWNEASAAAQYVVDLLRSRGFQAEKRLKDDIAGDSSDDEWDCSEWIEVRVAWGASSQWVEGVG